ncbi:MAG: hypothetical protein ACETWD_05845 [Desulfatiglandales bacterium]
MLIKKPRKGLLTWLKKIAITDVSPAHETAEGELSKFRPNEKLRCIIVLSFQEVSL